MIITCPSCSTRYPVDASAFPPAGRKVRCAKCGHNWLQPPPSDLPRKIDLEPTSPPSREPSDDAASQRPQPFTPIFNKSEPKTEAAMSGAAAALEEKAEEKSEVGFADEPDTDIVFAPPPASSVEPAITGGKLRAYLDGVASLRRGRVLSAVGWAALVVFVVGSLFGTFHYRNHIALLWPATAKFYAATGNPINLRGVEFHNVVYERQNENGLPVLAVKGNVVNISSDTRTLPKLRISLADAQDHELYHWTFAMTEKKLAPKASASFTTRLSSPPVEARSIEVRFVMKNEDVPNPAAASAAGGAMQAEAEGHASSH